jgi:SAM-dependent methyltransferase
MDSRQLFYDAARSFYGEVWPTQPKPYLHLESYLRCWLDPEAVFGLKQVLEVGAGECMYTRLIADKFGPRSIVACELFRERMLPALRANSNSALKAVSGDCFRLPFLNQSFDVVVASLVMSEIPCLQNALLEFKRVLKPRGLFVGWDPNPFNPVILYRYLTKPCSANQSLFWPHKVRPIFESTGFTPAIRFFYGKLPWAKSRFLATCIGIVATLTTDEVEPIETNGNSSTVSKAVD